MLTVPVNDIGVPRHKNWSGPAFGVGFAMTTTSVVTVPLHPPPLTLSVYIPPFATVAIGIVGFCALEVKPFGPVQAYIDPGVAKPFN